MDFEKCFKPIKNLEHKIEHEIDFADTCTSNSYSGVRFIIL